MLLIGDRRARGVRAFAHRGGAAEAPENSLAAFAAALALGFVDLETDVRATRDGVCVVHHDARLDRTTDRTGRLRDLPWREVRRARIDGTEPVCRLEDVLVATGGAHLTIDVKDASAVAPLLDALRRCGARDRVSIASFSAARSRAVREPLRAPGAASPAGVAALRGVSWLPRGLADRIPLPQRAYQVPPAVGPGRLVDDRLIRTAGRRGLEVHVWTIDDPAEMERLLDLGVHGIMTDRPTVLREVLRRRGLWPPADPARRGTGVR